MSFSVKCVCFFVVFSFTSTLFAQESSSLRFYDWDNSGLLFSEAAYYYGANPKVRKNEARPLIPEARKMVEREILPQHEWEDPIVLSAIMRTARDRFVPASYKKTAFRDLAVPLGRSRYQQAPSLLAYMTEELDVRPDEKVLHIGTGSGYYTAVLSLLAKEVYTVELDETLGNRASQTFEKLAYTNIYTKIADGYDGWEEHAPFDRIVFTCSPETVPEPLVKQLREGGVMIVPLGEPFRQVLYRCKKKGEELQKEFLLPYPFELMEGEAQSRRQTKPDPERPELSNGHFERFHENGEPYGWFSMTNAIVREVPDAPEGRHFLKLEVNSFSSDEARFARAEQSFALEGKNVSRLHLEAFLRGDRLETLSARNVRASASMILLCYDESDRLLQRYDLAPVSGSFDWKAFQCEISVPKKTKKATLILTLSDRTGTLEFDALSVRKAGKK